MGLGPKNSDFAEEIKTYLTDGIRDLMAQGLFEEEAVKITMEKFDKAELKPDFEEFMGEFNDFGITQQMEWYARNGEAIGMFCAGFTTIGLTLGALFGYLARYSLVSTIVGIGVGLGVGIGLAMLCHAMVAVFRQT